MLPCSEGYKTPESRSGCHSHPVLVAQNPGQEAQEEAGALAILSCTGGSRLLERRDVSIAVYPDWDNIFIHHIFLYKQIYCARNYEE